MKLGVFPAPLALPLDSDMQPFATILFPPGEKVWLQMVAYRNLRVEPGVLGTPQIPWNLCPLLGGGAEKVKFRPETPTKTPYLGEKNKSAD